MFYKLIYYLQEPEIAIPVLTKINLHGTVLLQNILQFGNPRLITTSLLDMKAISLKNLANDTHGSFVYDTIASSRTVGEKTRESLISKLKVSYNTIGPAYNSTVYIRASLV